MTPKLDLNPSSIAIQPARQRTAARRSGPSFGDVLAAGADVVLRGVETAAGVVGGPLLSGAVRGGRLGVGASLGAGGAAPGGAAASDAGTFDEVRALQEQAQAWNLEYLALQEQVQQQNRQFSTLSNVAKARHDTSKAVVQNIRS